MAANLYHTEPRDLHQYSLHASPIKAETSVQQMIRAKGDRDSHTTSHTSSETPSPATGTTVIPIRLGLHEYKG